MTDHTKDMVSDSQAITENKSDLTKTSLKKSIKFHLLAELTLVLALIGFYFFYRTQVFTPKTPASLQKELMEEIEATVDEVDGVNIPQRTEYTPRRMDDHPMFFYGNSINYQSNEATIYGDFNIQTKLYDLDNHNQAAVLLRAIQRGSDAYSSSYLVIYTLGELFEKEVPEGILTYSVVDLDESDNQREVKVEPFCYPGGCQSTFFRFDGEEIIEIGNLATVREINGDGTVLIRNFEQFWYREDVVSYDKEARAFLPLEIKSSYPVNQTFEILKEAPIYPYPSPGSDIVAMTTVGKEVTLVSAHNGTLNARGNYDWWYQVIYEGKTGWVSQSQIDDFDGGQIFDINRPG